MIYVCNSTPIIALAKIGQIRLIPAVLTKVILPEAVFKELTDAGKNRPGSSEIQNAKWIEVDKVKHSEYLQFLMTNLDKGEAEVIALAFEKRADLTIIDEKIARRIASQMRLPVIGTIGLLIKAKKMGIIDAVKPLWEK